MLDKTLFAIQAEYLSSIEELENYLNENETGIIPEEFLERLSINESELGDKLNDYVEVLQQYEAQVENYKARIEFFKTKTQRVEKVIAYLKQRMLDATLEFGITTSKGNRQLKTPIYNLSQRYSTVVEVEDVEKLPLQFQKIEVVFKPTVEDKDWYLSVIEELRNNGIELKIVPDKIALKKALAAIRMDGAQLKETPYLVIS